MTTPDQSRSLRWLDRRHYFADKETIDTRAYEVEELVGDGADRTARDFVERHHYSGTYPAALARFALRETRTAELAGVAVFSMPVRSCVLDVSPELRADADLGRFVLLDGVAVNGESWFLSRCLEMLRRDRGWRAIVTKSDPLARATADGRIVMPGHVGQIYQATNAGYLGRSRAEWERLLPDGTSLHNRAVAKIKAGERGWRPAAERLVELGADAIDEGDRAGWIERAIAKLCRRVKNPGKHRYAFGLDRHARRAVEDAAREAARAGGVWHPPMQPATLAYPKRAQVAA